MTVQKKIISCGQSIIITTIDGDDHDDDNDGAAEVYVDGGSLMAGTSARDRERGTPTPAPDRVQIHS